MMKFWKKICLCIMLMFMTTSLFACGKNNDRVSVDLDGDQVISTWETIYEKADPSTRVIQDANVQEVSSLDDLAKKIEEAGDTPTSYKLTKNIDCGGKAIAINLKNGTLYGNNKYITNFKLAQVPTGDSNDIVNSLFYNGNAVYDLRIFMGKQSYTFENTGKTTISPFVNTLKIENIEVKGWLDLIKKAGGSSASLDVSLCSGDISKFGLSGEGNVLDKQSTQILSDITVYGKITMDEYASVNTETNIGGVVSTFNKGATAYNCNSDVVIDELSSYIANVGLIVGENNGFMSTCTSTGKLMSRVRPISSRNGYYIGGICGKNGLVAELRNCKTDANIAFDYEFGRIDNDPIVVGGIVGYNDGGIVDYCTSDAKIDIKNAGVSTLGGICGKNHFCIFDNIISRGSINVVNSVSTTASNMIGITEYGYIKSAVVYTPINIDNTTIEGKASVWVGTLTKFETDSSGSVGGNPNDKMTYSAYKAPHMQGVIVMGENIIDGDGAMDVSLNYGLGNPFSWGTINTTVDPSVGEEGEEDDDTVTETIDYTVVAPQIFKSIYVVSDDWENTEEGIVYKKYKNTVKVDGAIDNDYPVPDYSSISTKNLVASGFVPFFRSNIGFKCGAGIDEVDLYSKKVEEIKFTLDEEKARLGYFTTKKQNNIYDNFDKFFELKQGADSNVQVNYTDELLSFFVNLIEKNVSTDTALVFNRSCFDNMATLDYVIEDIMGSGSEGNEETPTPDDTTQEGGNGDAPVEEQSGQAGIQEDEEETTDGEESEEDKAEVLLGEYSELFISFIKCTLAKNFALNADNVVVNRYNQFSQEITEDGVISGDTTTTEGEEETSVNKLRYVLFTLIMPEKKYSFRFDLSHITSYVDDNSGENFILYLTYKSN